MGRAKWTPVYGGSILRPVPQWSDVSILSNILPASRPLLARVAADFLAAGIHDPGYVWSNGLRLADSTRGLDPPGFRLMQGLRHPLSGPWKPRGGFCGGGQVWSDVGVCPVCTEGTAAVHHGANVDSGLRKGGPWSAGTAVPRGARISL